VSPNAPIALRQNLTDAEIEGQIRQRERAYELYHGRGGVDGNATDDWLKAKEEVLSYKTKAATASARPPSAGAFPAGSKTVALRITVPKGSSFETPH